MSLATLSTHVLDAVTGRPAAAITVILTDADGTTLATAATDPDGRVKALADLDPGIYRLTFATGAYFAAREVTTFYPEVVIAFEVTDAQAHYHVPLLLSPYAYSTYRGS
jgi:5-hydroxyisourate hydrolase